MRIFFIVSVMIRKFLNNLFPNDRQLRYNQFDIINERRLISEKNIV
jgi:hypothetical protein